MALGFTKKDIEKSQSTGTIEIPEINTKPKPAIVQGLYDLGTQMDKKYDSEELIERHKVWVQFEVPSVRVKVDGKDSPLIIGKEMTVSMSNRSHFYNLYKCTTGDDLNEDSVFSDMLGLPCLLTLEPRKDLEGNIRYPKIVPDSITGLPEGFPEPSPTIPREAFDIDNPTDDCQYMNNIVKSKIDQSIERTGRTNTQADVEVGAANVDISKHIN